VIFRMLLLGTSRWPPGVRDSAWGAAAGAPAGEPLASLAFGAASAFFAPPARACPAQLLFPLPAQS